MTDRLAAVNALQKDYKEMGIPDEEVLEALDTLRAILKKVNPAPMTDEEAYGFVCAMAIIYDMTKKTVNNKSGKNVLVLSEADWGALFRYGAESFKFAHDERPWPGQYL